MPTFLFASTTRPLPAIVRSDAKRFVELAVVEKKFVEVANVVVPNPTESELMVEDAATIRPRVVVGARYPFPCIDQSRNCDE